MQTQDDAPAEGLTEIPANAVETAALKCLSFYEENYDTLFFGGAAHGERHVLGTKPPKCRFCDEQNVTFKKVAHAVPELIGNKKIVSHYECDACNERMSKFEDDLAKFTMGERTMGGVKGKKGIPTLISRSGKSRIEYQNGALHFKVRADDESVQHTEENKTYSFEYMEQPYRPLGAYKALCKAAYTLLPPDELQHFTHLLRWLKEPDVETHAVYDAGKCLFLGSFAPGFKAFPQPIIALLRRRTIIDAPYLMFFAAFGNVSYQIFPPTPSMDRHLSNKEIQLVRYPHLFDLQPWRLPGKITHYHADLSEPERRSKPKKLRYSYTSRTDVTPPA